MSKLKKYVITAMCITLCSVLPLVLHAVPGAGNTVLPMHIPVLVCGLLLGGYFGFLAGFFGPMLSTFTTGMPMVAFLPAMMVELAAFGAVAGLMMRFVRTRNKLFNIYVSLITAMIIGRILGGAARAFIFAPGTMTMYLWVYSYFISSLPGIIIQLFLIPAIIVALEKAGMRPSVRSSR